MPLISTLLRAQREVLALLINTFLAGIIRDYTGDLDDKFFGQQAVYRVSMGSFVSRGHRICHLRASMA